VAGHQTLAYAAALRVARFGIANEHSDWETAHHVFTYANAVHQVLKRIGSGLPDPIEAERGLLPRGDGVYPSRYLIAPAALLPDESDEGSMTCPLQPRRSARLCSTP
jgi:hypothetical protein